jgi:hypothetical protein
MRSAPLRKPLDAAALTHDTERSQVAEPSIESDETPLTTALLEIAAVGVSFATPGHRSGRSCRRLRAW